MEQTVFKTTLANGIRILSKTMPHTRSVSMGVWVSVGARDESPSESGLSHLIEHMIFKGTQKRNALKIAKEFDAIGGQTNAFTSFESTCYHAKVLDDHVETMVDILSDIFLNSVFAESEIDKERPVIFQEMSMVEDNPEDFIHVLSGRYYWGDNPLGRSILGTRENLSRFKTDHLKSFFRRYYQPEHIVISIAGNLTHDQVLDLVGPVFEASRRGEQLPQRITPTAHPQIGLNHRDIEQVHLCVGTQGIPIADPNRFAFSLLNTIVGGNMSSRLFQKIRESKGYAYSVYSFLTSYIDTGFFGIYSAVNPDNAYKTISLIVDEIHKISSEPVTDAELSEAKEYIKGNLLLASESVDNQMVRLAQNEINFGYHTTLQEVVDRITAVEKEGIMTLAQDLFQSHRLSLTTLGPWTDKTLLEPIFGKVEVEHDIPSAHD